MKSKPENRQSLSRPRRFRKPEEVVLIVCEGNKSEPVYFESLCSKLGLKSRTVHAVEIHGAGGVPMTVVNEAIRLRDERKQLARKNAGLAYDHVWAVFDKNGHPNVNQAKQIARDEGISVAFSAPCFEFWFLLHFERSSSPFADCAEAIRQLKSFAPEYRKGLVPFEVGHNEILKNAMDGATWLRDQNNEEPYTDVDKLVKVLIDIAIAFGRIGAT